MIQHFIASDGWRTTQIWVGVICVVTLLPLSLLLRRRAPVAAFGRVQRERGGQARRRSAFRRMR